MVSTDAAYISPVQAAAILMVLGPRCERCGEDYPPTMMEVHGTRHGEGEFGHIDPQRQVLLLCIVCHSRVHARGSDPDEEEALTGKRPYHVRRAIREALGCYREPYHPPDQSDIPATYERCFQMDSLDLYWAG
jgi:hypothetical protein